MKTAVVKLLPAYDFHTAIQILNDRLNKEKPKIFNPFWIKIHEESVYKYFSENVQSVTGDIDWDFITINLEKRFQKRWKWLITNNNFYENRNEINIILVNYSEKLYVLIAPKNDGDKLLQDRIIVQLVRLAQRGNLLAKQYTTECLTVIIHEWMENSKHLSKWKHYTSEINARIECCIRNYRYSGSFMKYLFMSFYYFSKGLCSTCSLDEPIGKKNKTRIDYVAEENEYE